MKVTKALSSSKQIIPPRSLLTPSSSALTLQDMAYRIKNFRQTYPYMSLNPFSGNSLY